MQETPLFIQLMLEFYKFFEFISISTFSLQWIIGIAVIIVLMSASIRSPFQSKFYLLSFICHPIDRPCRFAWSPSLSQTYKFFRPQDSVWIIAYLRHAMGRPFCFLEINRFIVSSVINNRLELKFTFSKLSPLGRAEYISLIEYYAQRIKIES